MWPVPKQPLIAALAAALLLSTQTPAPVSGQAATVPLVVKFKPGSSLAERDGLTRSLGGNVRRRLDQVRSDVVHVPAGQEARLMALYAHSPNVERVTPAVRLGLAQVATATATVTPYGSTPTATRPAAVSPSATAAAPTSPPTAVPASASTAAATPAAPNAPPSATVSLSPAPSPTATAAAAPNDPLLAQQWALTAINWPQARASHPISGSAIVAVLDTGIDAGHPDLAGRVAAGQSFTGGNPNADPNGHGTAMAGIVAANVNNGLGIAGVAYAGVNVSSVQVLEADGGGWDADVAAGVLWAADSGARVLLMAFSSATYSAALADAVAYAVGKGIVVVAATGNDGGTEATYPAALPNVAGIGATDQGGRLASFSNRGAMALAAPGVNVETLARGGGSTQATGTSAAAAIAAAEAGLLAAAGLDGSRAANQLRAAVDSSPSGAAQLDLAKALGPLLPTVAVASPAGTPAAAGAAAFRVADGAIAFSPATITAGGAVAILASGFSPGETVSFTGPGFSVSNAADAGGAVSSTPRTPAFIGSGTYAVTAIGQSSGTTAVGSLTVSASSPSVSLSATTVTQGDSTTASAGGFDPGESVCFSFQVCATADSNGSVVSQAVRVPAFAPAGSTVFRAAGSSSGRVAILAGGLTVAASSQALAPSPNPVTQGAALTLTATGFLPGETVTFSGLSGGTATANGSGTAVLTIDPLPCVSGFSGSVVGAKGQTSSRLATATVATNAASPSVSFTGSQTRGSTLTISGSGFGNSEVLSIHGPFTSAPTPTSSGGSIPGGMTATIPGALQAGTYTLDVTGRTSGCEAQTQVTLGAGATGAATLTLNPTSATTGQTVNFTGSGFASGTNNVSVSQPYTPASVSASGPSISGSFVVSPSSRLSSSGGVDLYRIPASDGTNFGNATLKITALPSLTVSPNPAAQGSQVTLTASRFAPGDTVTFSGLGLQSAGVTATADSSGVAVATPTLSFGFPAGLGALKASNGSAVAVASVTTTRPALTETLSPTSLAPGSSISVSAAGFQPNEQVTLSGAVCASSAACTSTASTLSSASLTADGSGNISSSAFVPYFEAQGNHLISLAGASSSLHTSAAFATTSVFSPNASLSTTSGANGASVVVSGSGFAPSETIAIQPPGQTAITATASAGGAFSAGFAVSGCAVNGTYAVTVSGQTSGLNASPLFTVQGGPVSPPAGCGGSPVVSVATATATAAPSSSGSTSPSTSTAAASVAGGSAVSSSGSLVVSAGATSASGGASVIGQQAANTGVADVPAGFTAPTAGVVGVPSAPPVDPASITGNVPAPITAVVSAATGAVVLAGNVAIVLPPAALSAVPAGQLTVNVQPNPSVTIPGGPAQFSPNGTILNISFSDRNGNPVTTFPTLIPIEMKYNAADVGQANGNVSLLTAAYVIDAQSPPIENPNGFPIGTFVLFPPQNVSLNTAAGTVTASTQALGSTISVVTNPVGYVQTLAAAAPETSSFDPDTSQTFATKPQFSYLQVVEPQIGSRLLVIDPDSGNYAYVNAADVGPAGQPPPRSSSAVVRGLVQSSGAAATR
jgi:hypothetical protein